MPPKQMQLYPKMAPRLGQYLLRAKCKAELRLNLVHYFFICALAFPWPTFGCYQGNSLTHLILTTAFALSIFGSKVTGRVWVSISYSVPCGFDHNAITHLATHSKFQKILSPDQQPVCSECRNVSNKQNSYSLTLWWPLQLHNTSLNAKFSAQIFSFG